MLISRADSRRPLHAVLGACELKALYLLKTLCLSCYSSRVFVLNNSTISLRRSNTALIPRTPVLLACKDHGDNDAQE